MKIYERLCTLALISLCVFTLDIFSGNQHLAAAQSWSTTPTAKINYRRFSGNGTFIIGKDIRSGTYRTRTASFNCYFERLRGFGGTVDDIIANENTDAPAIVTIYSKDRGFRTSNCATWTQDLSAITRNKTVFADGTYIVGTDIKPGTYRMRKSSSGCYYARLKGFGGTIDDIIANNFISGRAIVTIAARDRGFQSANCGTWARV